MILEIVIFVTIIFFLLFTFFEHLENKEAENIRRKVKEENVENITSWDYDLPFD